MRGQITLFFVVGIIVTLLIAISLVVVNLTRDDTRQELSDISAADLSIFPVEKYMEGCVQLELLPVLRQIGSRGGFYNASYDPADLSFVNGYTSLYAGHHRIVSKEQVEQQLNELLPAKVQECFDTARYEELGYNVTAGDLSISFTLFPQHIESLVHFPVKLYRGDEIIERDTFPLLLDIPFGKVLDLAHTIINYEHELGYFDHIRYMHSANNIQSGLQLLIEKKKPYPHILYDIIIEYRGLNITYGFAIEGLTSFDSSSAQIRMQSAAPTSCCQLPNQCLSATTQQACLLAGGTFDANCACEDGSINEQQIATTPLLSCSGVQSGYSWCEPLVEKGAGARFAKKSCVDGVVVTESCRDYRQEVCVENVTPTMTYAKCRPNTGLTCLSCTDESCCSSADCQFIDGVCLPAVSFGLPHWDVAYSAQVCQGYFDEFVSHQGAPQTFVDAQRDCSLIADCGVNKQVLGEYDTRYVEQMMQKYAFNISRLAFESYLAPSPTVVFTQDNIAQLLTRFMAMLESYTVFLDNYLDDQDIQADSGYTCPVMQLEENNCRFCEVLGECSEYLCRSLGPDCVFYSGSCQMQTLGEPPQIVDIQMEQSVVAYQLADLWGYRSVSPVETNQHVEINITTDKPALCKPTYLPYMRYAEIGVPDLSDGIYSTNHTLQLLFINDLPVFEKIKTQFGAASYQELLTSFTDFKFLLDSLRSRNPDIQKYSPPFYGTLTRITNYYLDPTRSAIVEELFDNIAIKQYSIFFSCIDEQGSFKNDDFLSFILESSCQTVPTITQVRGDADPYVLEHFYVHTDILAECRYDQREQVFDQMSLNMSCPTHVFDTVDGEYVCVGNKTNAPVFIACQTHGGLLIENKTMNLTVNQTGLSSLLLNDSNQTVQNQTDIVVSFDTPYQCTYNQSLACGLESCTIVNATRSDQLICTPAFTSCYRDSIGTSRVVTFAMDALDELILNTIDTGSVIEITTNRPATCYHITDVNTRVYALEDVLDKYAIQEDYIQLRCADEYGYTASRLLSNT